MGKFSWRGFVSITLFVTFVLVLFSGVVLFIAPPGRIANWYGWSVLGIGKAGWENVHTLLSILFVLLGIFHLISNYRVLLSFLKRGGSWGGWKETVAGVLLVILLTLAAAKTWFPATLLERASESIRRYYDEVYVPRASERVGSSPAVHAELWSVDELAQRLSVRKEAVEEAWRSLGLEFSPRDKLGEVAKKNGMTPAELYSRTVSALRSLGSGGTDGGGYGRWGEGQKSGAGAEGGYGRGAGGGRRAGSGGGRRSRGNR